MGILTGTIQHIVQRQHDDSDVCCVAMAAGCSYEMAVEAIWRDGLAPAGTKIVRLTWAVLPSDIRKGLAALGIMLNQRGFFELEENFDVRTVQPALLSGFVGQSLKQCWVLLHEGIVYDPSLEGPIPYDDWATDMEGFMTLKNCRIHWPPE